MRRDYLRLRLGAAAVLTLVCFAAGCERTRVSDILKNPQRYEGYEVTIAGQVTATAAEGPVKESFEIDDGTGKISVLSTNYQLPERGARIAVTGLVESPVKLGSNTLPTALQEIKRQGQGGD